jgi:predicted integral membrane protein DUF2269
LNLFPWFLFAHVLGAFIAFGATYSTFPLLGMMSGNEPMHANFGSRVSSAISDRIVRPFAILQGLTGLGLIWTANIDLTKALWLDVAIVIYLFALGFALFVQIPLGHKIVALTSGGPPGAGPGTAGPPAEAPKGPPPELLATVQSARRGGMILAVAIAVIVFLMVVKPF